MRVVVADDQITVREGLVTLLTTVPDTEVVGSAGDGEAALELVARAAPDVVLMDLRMPRIDGIEATRRVRAAHPSTQVVVLTTYADDESILDALRAGAIGYLTKDAGRDDHIHRAIQAAAAGQALLDAAVQARLVDVARLPPTAPTELPDGLTEREGEVLRLIASGKSNREIAGQLYLSDATVKTHVNHIFAKTSCRVRAQAVSYAHHHGLTWPLSQEPTEPARHRGKEQPKLARKARSAGRAGCSAPTSSADSPCQHCAARFRLPVSPA
jgi:DNA-binding NarL/FixJ family response regulator